jgi:hypothetical protein
MRDTELANVPSYISSSGCLCHPLNHKILDATLLRLRFCSIRNDKSGLKLSAKQWYIGKSRVPDPCSAPGKH